MPKQYKSARGRPVDMGAFVSQNENTRAVGNMNVNARGDEVDSGNRPVKSRNQAVQRHYNNQVGQRITAPAAPAVVPPAPAPAQRLQEDPVTFPKDVAEDDDAREDWEPLPQTQSAAPIAEDSKPSKEGGLAQAMARAREVKKNG